MPKNIKIMLLLFAIAALYVFVFGCDDSVTVNTDGNIEDWSVENLDTVIEKVAEPVLDAGDAAVDAAREIIEDTARWGNDQDDKLDELWGVW